MFLPAILLIASISIILIMFFNKTNKEKIIWTHFYTRGKDAGFTIRELEILRRLILQINPEEPSSLFTSQEHLENCIRNFIRAINLAGGTGDPESQDLLSKLFDYRQKIEVDKPTGRGGIYSSRQISNGQNLRVLVEGSGVFRSQVIVNNDSSLVISLPISNKAPGSFSWMGQRLSIYFWREEDAGYVFDTDVMDELITRGLASLKVNHSDSLFRTQKRKSIRLKLHKPAYLYLLENDEDANVPETEPGLNCYLEDLSDSGCAIMVGGLGEADMRIKVQFELNNNPIIMSGTVRSVAYKEDLNRSLLRVEADPLLIEMRNIILGEVFGMMPEDEDDLPFKLLSEEAEKMNADRGIGAVARGDLDGIGALFN